LLKAIHNCFFKIDSPSSNPIDSLGLDVALVGFGINRKDPDSILATATALTIGGDA